MAERKKPVPHVATDFRELAGEMLEYNVADEYASPEYTEISTAERLCIPRHRVAEIVARLKERHSHQPAVPPHTLVLLTKSVAGRQFYGQVVRKCKPQEVVQLVCVDRWRTYLGRDWYVVCTSQGEDYFLRESFEVVPEITE